MYIHNRKQLLSPSLSAAVALCPSIYKGFDIPEHKLPESDEDTVSEVFGQQIRPLLRLKGLIFFNDV